MNSIRNLLSPARYWFLSLAFISLACGPSRENADLHISSKALSVQYDGTGIHYIEWDGVNVLEGVGGYYIIGSCTGADTPDQNVISLGSDGNTLHAPGTCPGAPFSIQFSGTNPVHASISVGPLPVDYRSLSVPFDPTMAYFDSFRISSSGYLVGCANTWSPRDGSGGLFSDIPQPCTIPGHGAVGVARITDPTVGWWGEISGSVVTVRRTILGGNIQEAVFINHPYTHNMELSFQVEPVSEHILPAGSVYTLEEEISFRDPNSAPTENAELVSVDIPASLTAGSLVEASVTMRNSGETTWTEPADHMGGTRLGSLADNQLQWIPGQAGGYYFGPDDQRLYLPESVGPGQQVTITFAIQAPQQLGTYQFSAQMVHDGVAWFGPQIRQTVEITSGPCGGGAVNACGGCSTLSGQPGEQCGACGAYECDGIDSVLCEDPGYNECGQCGPLPDAGCGQDTDGNTGGDLDAGVDAGVDAGGDGSADGATGDTGLDADHGAGSDHAESKADEDELPSLVEQGCGCASGNSRPGISFFTMLLLCFVLSGITRLSWRRR